MKSYQSILCFLLALIGLLQTFAATTSRYTEPYPSAASKKGLQVEMVDDALYLGIKHAGLNINLSQLVDPSGDSKILLGHTTVKPITFSVVTLLGWIHRSVPFPRKGF